MDKLAKSLKKDSLSNVRNVDKLSKSVDNNAKFKSREMRRLVKKPKILRINLEEMALEGNLIEMPFALLDSPRKRKDLITVIEYKWTDSKGNDRGIEVRGSGKYGIPTLYEFDVLVALLRIYAKSEKVLLNQYYIEDENISEDDIAINFTLTQVAEELGVKKPSSIVLNKILIAIEILTDTTIYNRYSGGIYDVSTQSYIEDKSIAFHIVEKFEATLYRNDENQKRGRGVIQKIKLNKFFYKSLSGGYLTFCDHTKYVDLKNGVGKRLFLILNKWKVNNKNYLKIKYETLYQRIPLDDLIAVRQKNQSIKRGLQSLIEVGFIKDFDMKDGFITVYFNNSNIEENNDTMYFKRMYNTHNDIIKKLELLNFTQSEIFKSMSIITFDNEYVKALLRYADTLNQYGKIDNMKGFVTSGLTKKYDIDKKYYS